jgi:hypothetical protein
MEKVRNDVVECVFKRLENSISKESMEYFMRKKELFDEQSKYLNKIINENEERMTSTPEQEVGKKKETAINIFEKFKNQNGITETSINDNTIFLNFSKFLIEQSKKKKVIENGRMIEYMYIGILSMMKDREVKNISMYDCVNNLKSQIQLTSISNYIKGFDNFYTLCLVILLLNDNSCYVSAENEKNVKNDIENSSLVFLIACCEKENEFSAVKKYKSQEEYISKFKSNEINYTELIKIYTTYNIITTTNLIPNVIRSMNSKIKNSNDFDNLIGIVKDNLLLIVYNIIKDIEWSYVIQTVDNEKKGYSIENIIEFVYQIISKISNKRLEIDNLMKQFKRQISKIFFHQALAKTMTMFSLPKFRSIKYIEIEENFQKILEMCFDNNVVDFLSSFYDSFVSKIFTKIFFIFFIDSKLNLENFYSFFSKINQTINNILSKRFSSYTTDNETEIELDIIQKEMKHTMLFKTIDISIKQINEFLFENNINVIDKNELKK